MPRFYERTDLSPNGDNESQIQKFLNHDPYYTHHFEEPVDGLPTGQEALAVLVVAALVGLLLSVTYGA